MNKEVFKLYNFITEFEETILGSVDLDKKGYTDYEGAIWEIVIEFLERWQLNYRIIDRKRELLEVQGMDMLRRQH